MCAGTDRVSVVQPYLAILLSSVRVHSWNRTKWRVVSGGGRPVAALSVSDPSALTQLNRWVALGGMGPDVHRDLLVLIRSPTRVPMYIGTHANHQITWDATLEACATNYLALS